VAIREAKERLGERIAIVAVLDQLFGSMKDWEWVRTSIREMFEGASPEECQKYQAEFLEFE